MQNTIEVLQAMRAELAQRIAALDSAISFLTGSHGAFPDVYEPERKEEQEEQKPVYKGRAGNTTFESDFDFTSQAQGYSFPEPEGPWECPKCGNINPAGARSCHVCDAKPSAGKASSKRATRSSSALR